MFNYERMPLLSSTTSVEVQVLLCSTVAHPCGTVSQAFWLKNSLIPPGEEFPTEVVGD